MQDRAYRCSRRKFLASAAALTISGGMHGASGGDSPALPRTHPGLFPTEGRKPIALVCTVYRALSDAYHLAGRFLHGYMRAGKHHLPAHYIHSIYVDQTPDNDLSQQIARKFGIRVTRNVEEALTAGGNLAVEGVLLLGEHGNYPRNSKGQILYPRYEFMEQVVSAFRQTGKTVPVFNYKHLSYRWDRAKQMVDWSREMTFPLMAGSSLPVTWRTPELEPRLESPFEEALVAGYGPIEVHGFHALEAIQCMLERRIGGETGVKSVTCLSGKDVWRAGDQGKWSWQLLEAALSRSETLNVGDVRDNVGTMNVQGMPPTPATAFLVEYRDGTRGTVLLLNGHVADFCFAGKLRGEKEPISCLFHFPPPPGARSFDPLVANIEKFLETGLPPYPVERTLLTTGILDAALESHSLRGKRIETSHLDFAYAAPADSGFFRGPSSIG